MKIRYKAPKGGGTLEFDDDATVNQLFATLKSTTGYADVTIKYSWPPKALDSDQGDTTLQSLGLQRESLTIVPAEDASATAAEPPQAAQQPTTSPDALPSLQSFEGQGKTKSKSIIDQNISVPMPETGSNLVLRVMPDDNSCLFTAVGGALRGLRTAPDEFYSADSLRRLIVDHIRNNPEKFSAAILGKSPEAYCRNMLRPDVWGGEIELAVISDVFAIEIVVVNVKDGHVYRIGENNGYNMRCVLVYSNVHYDRIAEIFVEGQAAMEFDITRWAVDGSDHVIQHTIQMCKKLKEEYHYYTDTSDFVITCNQCGWVGQGQKALAEHSLSTGHTDISEIKDQ
ncbi:OTU-domain-containing protein [Hypoxylon trugodes]|uniref:OTU-domain-containing protein n=1 Tax=Hypoxylon trugodes TaxID=326681 RepID=UPI00219D4277|nr:OTU-domain-containing protein [Hypoxylon trugodes]KAI1385309.1 OTU-domain-containing protein [Hypoxylon trugodes]